MIIAFLLGRSACMSRHYPTEHVVQIQKGFQLLFHFPGLVDDSPDSDQEMQVLSVFPYHCWVLKKKKRYFSASSLSAFCLACLFRQEALRKTMTNDKLFWKEHLIKSCLMKCTWPLNTAQLPLLCPTWTEWGKRAARDGQVPRGTGEN